LLFAIHSTRDTGPLIVISAGPRTLTVRDAPTKASLEPVAGGAVAAADASTPELAEARARHSARRVAFALMAGSSVLAIAILGGLWLLLHGTP